MCKRAIECGTWLLLVLPAWLGAAATPPLHTLTLRFEQPVACTMEWLAVGPEGLRSVGRESLAATPSSRLEVPPDARLFRIRRQAAAPWTAALAAVVSGEVKVPPAVNGGELLVVLSPHRVLPARLAISGPSWSGEIDVPDSRVIERSGLASGSYEISAIYAGEERFRLRAVDVGRGESSDEVPLELPEVGAVRLGAVPELCSRDAGIVLGKEPTDAAQEPGRRIRARLSEQCSIEIAGLVPGTYFATLEDESGDHVFAAAEARVQTDRISEAPLVPVEVRVVGRVHTHGGRPVSGVRLSARFRDHETSSPVSRDGTLALRVPATGTWDLSLDSEGGPELWFQRVHLRPGDNPVDIETLAAELRLSIRRADGKPIEEPVDVSVEPFNDLGGWNLTYLPEQLPVVEIDGLGAGRYSVYAATPSGLYSPGNTPFELSEAEPTARVDLALEKPALTIHLKNMRGEPVWGQLAVGPMTTYAQRTAGVFMLPSLPRGEPMSISPREGLPICRRVPAGDELELTVQSGHESLVLLFPGRKDKPYLQLEGLPESDCPVDLEGSVPRDSVQQSGGVGEIIEGLPAGRYTILTEDGQRVSATVPGPPVTILPSVAVKSAE